MSDRLPDVQAPAALEPGPGGPGAALDDRYNPRVLEPAPPQEIAAPAPQPSLLERLAPGLDGQTLVVIVSLLAVLLVSHYEGSTGWFNANVRGHFPNARNHVLEVASHVWWFGTSVVLYMLIPCAIALVARAPRLSTLGTGAGDWRFGLAMSGALLVVMLPIVWLASGSGDFISQYPMCSEALRSWQLFAVYELTYVAYFASWEFIFRGWMLFGLAPRVGAGMAIALQTIPFALMHAGKPELECYGSILAGLALGVLAWRTRSFWYGALVHAVIAFAMDILAGRHHPGIFNPFAH